MPVPCPGPTWPGPPALLTGELVALLTSAPGPLFSVFVPALPLAHRSVSWVKFFRRRIDLLEHALTTQTKLPAHRIYSSQSTKQRARNLSCPCSHLSSPNWCGCPGPSCRLDGSCQCIRDKFPSPAAITSDRCPALPCHALPCPALPCARCQVTRPLGRSVCIIDS